MAIVAQNSKYGQTGRTILAWAVGLLFFFPIFWLVLTSFKTDADAVKPEFLFFFTPTLDNYLNMTENYDYWRFATNSVITSVFATIFALAVGIPCAYAMAFNPTRATKDVLMWMLSTKMLPAAAVLYPMTFLTKSLGLFDTHFMVIVVLCLINLPIVIWIVTDQFRGIPYDLDEAARLEGASQFTIMRKICLPLAMPGVAVSAIFSFIFSWNELMFGLVLTRSEAKTAPAMAVSFMEGYNLPYGKIMATSTLIVIPVLIFALIASKQLVRGLTMGAVK